MSFSSARLAAAKPLGGRHRPGADREWELDKFDLLILDDLAYATKDQAETSVLFRQA